MWCVPGTRNRRQGRPIAFISKAFKQGELSAHIYEKEAFSIIWAYRKLREFLEGHKFIIHTDCRAVQYITQMKERKPKIMRWALEISSWDAEIKKVSGKYNVEADAMSRNSLTSPEREDKWFEGEEDTTTYPIASLFQNTITASQMKEEQRKDKHCQKILEEIRRSNSDEARGFRVIQGILKKRVLYDVTETQRDDEIDLESDDGEGLISTTALLVRVPQKTTRPICGAVAKRMKKADALLRSAKNRLRKSGERNNTGPPVQTNLKKKEMKPDGNTILAKNLIKPGRTSKNYFVPVIPESLKITIMEMFHYPPHAGHFSTSATLRKIKERAYWDFMNKEIREYCQNCLTCQQSKASNHLPYGLMEPVLPPTKVFEKISIDFIGPLPKSGGGRLNEYLLVIVDNLSKWVELFPMRKANSKKVLTILEDEIFCRYGVPSTIVTDCGSQFLSKIFKKMCQYWNIEHKTTAPYHHQGNTAERVNRTVVQMLQAYASERHTEWDVHIQKFAFALRTTVNRSTGVPPSILNLARILPFPFDREMNKTGVTDDRTAVSNQRKLPEKLRAVIEYVRSNIAKVQDTNKKHYDAKHIPHNFHSGDRVLIRNHERSDKEAKKIMKLNRRFIGPFVLGAQLNNVTFEILSLRIRKLVRKRHVNDIKPYVRHPNSKRRTVVRSPIADQLEEIDEERDDSQEKMTLRTRRRVNYRTLAGY